MAIGKPAQPIDFAAIDQKPVRLVILLASPLDKTSDHIQALARVSRLMVKEDFRERLYNAAGAQEIYNLLAEQEQAVAQA
jgi:mannitol/fructose-specific phosphotransferase system IIA component (Ntr-type)